MDNEETSLGRRDAPKAASIAAPDQDELSRKARAAVHHPPDPRLDRQLARLGLTDQSEPGDDRPSQGASGSIVATSEQQRLERKLRRIEIILGALIAVVGVVVLIEVILLLR